MGYDVFISFKRGTLDGSGLTRDYALASDLHKTLRANDIDTFFSEKDLSSADFIHEIYRVLDEAKILIVVGTKREHVESEWVRSEWGAFLGAILGKRKPDGQIYTYIEGMTPNDLPLELYSKQSYRPDQKAELTIRVMQNLGKTNSLPAAPPPETKAHALSYVPYLRMHVGDTLPLGRYPQGSGGEVLPLKWRVLALQYGKALLITDKLIDYQKYNDKLTDHMTWETCTLRQWLNSAFLSNAFDRELQSKIAMVSNPNHDNPSYGTYGGAATHDKIFMLSMDEAKTYFSSNADRKAFTTDYAHAKGYDTKDKSEWWWLRSPGSLGNGAACVSYDGSVRSNGQLVSHDGVAIRPALWLNL